MKRGIFRVFSLVMTVALLMCSFLVKMSVSATSDRDIPNPVVVSVNDGMLSIGNTFIQRNVSFAGGKVATTSIVNNRSGITLIPNEGSEDFKICVTNEYTDNADTKPEFEIKASELTLVGEPRVTSSDGYTRVAFSFEPYNKNGVLWSVTYNIAMKDGDHFMRSFLEISVPEADYANAYINYIDVDAFNVGKLDDSLLFCRPEKIFRQFISDFQQGLGQPLYVNSLFFGIEFQATNNRILPHPKAENADKDKNLLMRYYSGKNFEQIRKTVDGKFVTWPAVVGAARASDYEVVQDDFFDYINGIAQGTYFRTQFNTWYDGGMNITPQSLTTSFMGIEQGLTQAGCPPINAYIVDDGYNDYSGPFWGFKPAFANNALKDISQMMTDAGGAFAKWISPRGGYGQNQSPFMEVAGTGYRSSGDGSICAAAPKYIKNLYDDLCFNMDEYNVNYWKVDGIARSVCSNPNHGHMVGGTVTGAAKGGSRPEDNDTNASSVWYFTELWENYNQMFLDMRAHQKARGKDVFINSTGTSIPSPWYLQYTNTIKVITSADWGKAGPTTGINGPVGDGARRLSYRDVGYWRFFLSNKFQFPYNYIWNHDPIYALGNQFVEMTDQDLRENLYGNAMRGVAVWELLFSPSIFTEGQWLATNEVLSFSQENQHILNNSRMIAPLGELTEGNTEDSVNPYIYSAWVEQEGYVSFRNPKASTSVKMSLTLDRRAGVKEGMHDLTMTYVLPSKIEPGKVTNRKEVYNYGDTIEVTLEPLDFIILHFGPKDNTPPEVLKTEVLDANTLRVTFNEAIELSDAPITIANHNVTGVELTADFRAVDITVSDAFADNEAISLTSLSVKDLSANQSTVTAKARYAADRLISQFDSAADLTGSINVYDDALLESAVLSLDGNTANFANGHSADQTNKLSVASLIKTTDTDATILEQAGEYSVKINADGKIEFTVGALTVQSKQAINDGTWHHFACIKEPNEMLKVYIDGKISASVYNGSNLNILNAGKVTIGSAAFTGELSQIKIYNKSLGYLEVADLATQPLFTYDLAGYNAFTIAGMEPRLPGSVQTRYDTTNYFRNYDAVWDKMSKDDYALPGKVKINGTLPDFESLAVSGTLSVIPEWPAGSTLKGTDLNEVLTELKDKGWEILNQNDSRLSVNSSGLAITAGPGKMDRGNIDPTDPEGKRILEDVVNKNFFLIDTGLDDYCVTVTVNGRPNHMNKSAGLIFRQDDDNFVRMTYRVSGCTGNGARPAMSLNVKDGDYAFTLEESPNPALNTYHLALDKKGDYYTGYYSSDGVNWTKLGTVKASLENPKVGFHATEGVRRVPNYPITDWSPRFSNFTIRQYSVGLTPSVDTAGNLDLPLNAKTPRYTWADTTFSDGSKGSLLVELPEIDTSEPGELTVQGAIAGDPTATVPITVNVAKIKVTDVRVKNKQANIDFDIRSANGKGYSIYLSETGEDGTFEVYNDVNYNSKGAHVRGLVNGKTYYVYVVYSENGSIIEKSDILILKPKK